MIHADHAHVPVGTLADHEGTPVTIRRDYSHGLIPAMELTVAGIEQLAGILAVLHAQMVAAEAEMAAEAEALRQAEAAEDRQGPAEADFWGALGDAVSAAKELFAEDDAPGTREGNDDGDRDRQRFGRPVL